MRPMAAASTDAALLTATAQLSVRAASTDEAAADASSSSVEAMDTGNDRKRVHEGGRSSQSKLSRPAQPEVSVRLQQVQDLDPSAAGGLGELLEFLRCDKSLRVHAAVFDKLVPLDPALLEAKVADIRKLAGRKTGSPKLAVCLLSRFGAEKLAECVDVLRLASKSADGDVKSAADECLAKLQRIKAPAMPMNVSMVSPPDADSTAFALKIEQRAEASDGSEAGWRVTIEPHSGRELKEGRTEAFTEHSTSYPSEDMLKELLVGRYSTRGGTLVVSSLKLIGHREYCAIVTIAWQLQLAPLELSFDEGVAPPASTHEIYPQQWLMSLELAERVRRCCGSQTWGAMHSKRFQQVSHRQQVPQ